MEIEDIDQSSALNLNKRKLGRRWTGDDNTNFVK